MRTAPVTARCWCVAPSLGARRSHVPFTSGEDNADIAFRGRRLNREGTVEQRGGRRLTPRAQARLIGCFVAGVGLINVGSALMPEAESRLEWVRGFLTPSVVDSADGATALAGLALLLIGRGLVHRRRFAYRIALVLLGISVITHVLKGLDIEEAVIALAAAITLVSARRIFTVPIAPARWRTLVTAVPAVVGGVFAYGAIGLIFRRSEVVETLTPRNVGQEVLARLFGMSGGLHINGRFGQWFPASITAVGIAAVIVILFLVLAPVAEHVVSDPAARERARRLLDRADGDSLDPFALRHDKHYVFSSDGNAAVAYRYVTGVGLMSGDPIGDTDSFYDALGTFLDLCDEQGWRYAALGARKDRLPLYESCGLRSMYLGDEAIIDTASFTLEGRKMRPVRQATNRTLTHGITCEIHREGELDPTLRRALIGIAERHRGGAPERGFSMALDGLLEGRHPDALVTVARDGLGAPFAFQRYIPCRAGRALSLDAMRRDRAGAKGINGVNERMIVETVRWAQENDVDEVSLNFAVAKDILTEGADLSSVEAAEAWVLRRLNGYFQIESLLSFNAKFHPRWVSRYLVYRSIADLLPVAVAALSAEAFLPLDRNRDCGGIDADENEADGAAKEGVVQGANDGTVRENAPAPCDEELVRAK
jgi:lysyl-tRNA synthetase class 2